MTEKTIQKVPLAEALEDLSHLMEVIDDAEVLDSFIKAQFDMVRGDFTNALSRRVCLLQTIPGAIERAKEMKNEWAKKVKTLERIEEGLKNHTIGLVKANPEIRFTSPLGSFCVQENASPALSTTLNLGSKTVTNILNLDDMEKVGEEFMQAITYFTLMNDKLKEALMSGREFSWASLKLGEHLRIKK